MCKLWNSFTTMPELTNTVLNHVHPWSWRLAKSNRKSQQKLQIFNYSAINGNYTHVHHRSSACIPHSHTLTFAWSCAVWYWHCAERMALGCWYCENVFSWVNLSYNQQFGSYLPINPLIEPEPCSSIIEPCFLNIKFRKYSIPFVTSIDQQNKRLFTTYRSLAELHLFVTPPHEERCYVIRGHIRDLSPALSKAHV